MLVTGWWLLKQGQRESAFGAGPKCAQSSVTARPDIRPRLRSGLVWILFAGALLLATAPVWRLWAFGFNPRLDELLQSQFAAGP